MSSEVDICNMALAHIGASARVTSIDPPDGSAEATHCARFFYPARDSMLESPWTFNLRRAAGVLVSTETDSQWDYLFAYPSDALTVLEVLPAGVSEDAEYSVPFKVEMAGNAQVVATDEPDVVIRYAALVTDAQLFSPTFVIATAWMLASMLAGPIVRGDAGAALAQRCLQMAEMFRGKAATSNAKQRQGRAKHIPSFIRARGGGSVG